MGSKSGILKNNKHEIQIRQVHVNDLDACARIEDECYNKQGATRKRIERRIREYPEGFMVAVSGEKVAGFINSGCIHADDIKNENLKDLKGHDSSGKNRVIFSLAVRPCFQGMGISRLLMEKFILESRKVKKSLVLLICREHLISFYKRFGFVYRAPSIATYGGFTWHEMVLNLKKKELL